MQSQGTDQKIKKESETKKLMWTIDKMSQTMERVHRTRVGETLDSKQRIVTTVQALMTELIKIEKECKDMHDRHIELLDAELTRVQGELDKFRKALGQVNKEKKEEYRMKEEEEEEEEEKEEKEKEEKEKEKDSLQSIQKIKEELEVWSKSFHFPLAMSSLQSHLPYTKDMFSFLRYVRASPVDVKQSKFVFDDKKGQTFLKLVDYDGVSIFKGFEKYMQVCDQMNGTEDWLSCSDGSYSFRYKPLETKYGWQESRLFFPARNPFSAPECLSCTVHVPPKSAGCIISDSDIQLPVVWTKDMLVLSTRKGFVGIDSLGNTKSLSPPPTFEKAKCTAILTDEKHRLYRVQENRSRKAVCHIFQWQETQWKEMSVLSNTDRVLGICNNKIHYITTSGEYALSCLPCLDAHDSGTFKIIWKNDFIEKLLLSHCDSQKMAISPDGTKTFHVLDNRIGVLDAKTGHVVSSMVVQDQHLCSITCSKHVLFASSEYSVHEFDASNFRFLGKWSLQRPIESIAVVGDGSTLTVRYALWTSIHLFRVCEKPVWFQKRTVVL